MTGKPIRKAEKRGTVPLLNQIKANRMILITGTALSTMTIGLTSKEKKGLLPARIPKIVALMTMIKKLSRALDTVIPTCKANGEDEAKAAKAFTTGPTSGSRIWLSISIAPSCQTSMSNREEPKTTRCRFVRVFIGYLLQIQCI